MTELVLPEGFRISTIQVGGSGRGDEVFVLALFRWSPVCATPNPSTKELNPND